MSTANRKRRTSAYIDSSVIIAFLKGEEKRCAIAADILKSAEADKLHICTSTLTVVEVCRPQNGGTLQGKESDKALAFFEYDFITLVDLDRRTAEQAHEFCVNYGVAPADAIHLASALKAKCDVLWAWDDRFTNKSRKLQEDRVEIRIEEPRILDGQLVICDDES